MKPPAVNRLRLFNFFYFSLLAIFISFLPVYMDAKGLSASQIGIVMGTGGLVGIVSQPFWGVVSDRLRSVKPIATALTVASAAIGFFLFREDSFLFLLLFTGLMYFFLLPVDPLAESLNIRTAEAHGVSYGAIRTFGAVGYAAASLAAGWLLLRFETGVLAYAFVGVAAACAWSVSFVKDAPASGAPLTLRSLREFFAGGKTLAFFALVLLTAIPHRMNDVYLGVYLKRLGGGDELVGLAWFLSASSEIAVFAVSYWWLRKGREYELIAIATLLYVAKFALTAWVRDPVAVAWLQLFQAFTFPLFYSAAVQYLFRIVPEEWRATGQTVLAVLFFGVSGIAASYAGGWLFEALGGSRMYLVMAGVAAAAFGFSLISAKRRG
ncbi:MAG TPA: MFS transporter [Paenibacillus sp.]|nr:MFS transporter [Paenibacillus sp.]